MDAPEIMAPSAAALDTLPEELITNIAARLNVDDVSALRLTCRNVEAKCLHEFGSQYCKFRNAWIPRGMCSAA